MQSQGNKSFGLFLNSDFYSYLISLFKYGFLSICLSAFFIGCQLPKFTGLNRFLDRVFPQRQIQEPNSNTENKPENGKEIKSESENEISFDSLPAESKMRLPPGLRDFQDVFSDVAEKAIPAVVSIYSERNTRSPETGSPYDDFLDNGPFQYFFGERQPQQPQPREHKESGLGSGVIITSSGYILTNNHVIENADIIKVKLFDDIEYPATLVGADKASDMAVIKITLKDTKLPTLPMGNSDKLRIGEWVLAVGNPYGLSHTVTTGIISAKGRKNTGINSYENFLQTDAAINPGNSGGALVNLSGELVGINTAIFSRTGGYQGIGFAIPVNMAKKITQDLIRDGAVTRGWLGVSIEPLNDETLEALNLKNGKNEKPIQGALVNGVVPDSPAEKAGIKRGDIITKVGMSEIADASDLLNRIATLIPKESVEISVLRGGVSRTFKAIIAKRDEGRVARVQGEDENQPSNSIGLQVAELNPELRARFHVPRSLNQGVIVIAVESKSRSAAKKILPGDVILEINRIEVMDIPTFRSAMNQASKGNKILLLLNRRGNTFFLTL